MIYMNDDFDVAIDFARNHSDIPFCAKMARNFDRLGFLTTKQVEMLLRIRRERTR